MIIIDTDVLLLAFAFHRDERQSDNDRFLQWVQNDKPATTIYNVMELLGHLSFNLNTQKLLEWHKWLVDAYRLTIIWPNTNKETPLDFFKEEIVERPLHLMSRRGTSFADSLVLNLANRTPGATALVTWNTRHFQGRVPLPIMTPLAYLDQTN